MAGSFARCVVRQLQVGNIQKALRFGRFHTTRWTLFTPRAASTVSGASLAFFWVYHVTKIKGPKTEFIKFTKKKRKFEEIETERGLTVLDSDEGQTIYNYS